jgi:choline dehydrogenase
MGIEVVLDLPGVGENYHDHPASPIHMETRDWTSYGWSLKAMPRDLWCALQYLLTRTGPLAGNVFESVAFLRTDPTLERPDVQFVFQPAKRPDQSEDPLPARPRLRDQPGGALSQEPRHGAPRQQDPAAAPLIDPHLLEDPTTSSR